MIESQMYLGIDNGASLLLFLFANLGIVWAILIYKKCRNKRKADMYLMP